MVEKEVSLNVLLVEDNQGDAKLVDHHLKAAPEADMAGEVTLTHEESLTDALAEIARGTYDVIFLDLGLPESTGLATLDRTMEAVTDIPIVVLTGLEDRETAVEAIQRGAQDYLPKNDLDANTLGRALRYSIERHRQEQKLRRQNERLDRFASVVSHDLRNPLTVAKGRAAFARTECDSEHLEVVMDAQSRMETLIEDLLTLARQGESIGPAEPVDLETAIEDCWQNVDVGDSTVTIGSDGTIQADENRLKQLLENLFRNALEHNDEPVTITVGVEEGVLYVEDDGSGIDAGHRREIFESGYSTSDDGTGLGLMIVEEIVKAHGWSISVTESEDGGARFEMTGVDVAS